MDAMTTAAARTTAVGRVPWVVACVAFAVTAVGLVSNPVAIALDGTEWSYPLPLMVVVILALIGCAVQAAGLLFSPRQPALAALITVLAYVAVVGFLEIPNWVAQMPLVVAAAMFFLGAQQSVPTSVLWVIAVTLIAMAGTLAWVLSTGATLGVVAGFMFQTAVTFFAPVAGATALGVWWGARARRVAKIEADAVRADYEHVGRLEAARVQERARIAQELHDVAGQHLAGLITVADTALDVPISSVRQALSMVEAMRAEGRFASASLYAALRDLREANPEEPDRTPDIRSLTDLAGFWRRRGVSVSIGEVADASGLPAVVSTSVYRVVQEALTNAVKHAPGAQIAVDVVVDTALVSATVVNTPPLSSRPATTPAQGLGWGIDGLRQRVSLLGGDLTTEPTPEGGWLVAVDIPLAQSAFDQSNA